MQDDTFTNETTDSFINKKREIQNQIYMQDTGTSNQDHQLQQSAHEYALSANSLRKVEIPIGAVN